MTQKAIPVYYPANSSAWRKWLEKHHDKEDAVWVVFYNKASGKRSITWSEAVDVALCFGWIDSKKIKIDEDTAHQFFSRRKPLSTWSKINKEKVERLTQEGLMTEAGYRSVRVAQENGSWNVLDSVEELIVPKDLEKALKAHKGASVFFQSLSKTTRKMMLQWLVMARKPETREKRVAEIASAAAEQKKPRPF